MVEATLMGITRRSIRSGGKSVGRRGDHIGTARIGYLCETYMSSDNSETVREGEQPLHVSSRPTYPRRRLAIDPGEVGSSYSCSLLNIPRVGCTPTYISEDGS